MTQSEKTSNKILRGSADNNILFEDLRSLLLHLGFEERIRGSHHIFSRFDIAEILNLQPKGALAKPYQVKQVRKVFVQYKIGGIIEEGR
jgi:predicted RNA binding protein YcfA (HicA-like mRNA interferase family)